MRINAYDAITDEQRKQVADAFKFVHLPITMKCKLCGDYTPTHAYILDLIKEAQYLIHKLFTEGKYTVNQNGRIVFDYDDTLMTEFKFCYSCTIEIQDEHPDTDDETEDEE